jgi:hypothetical protein
VIASQLDEGLQRSCQVSLKARAGEDQLQRVQAATPAQCVGSSSGDHAVPAPHTGSRMHAAPPQALLDGITTQGAQLSSRPPVAARSPADVSAPRAATGSRDESDGTRSLMTKHFSSKSAVSSQPAAALGSATNGSDVPHSATPKRALEDKVDNVRHSPAKRCRMDRTYGTGGCPLRERMLCSVEASIRAHI